MTLTLQKGQSGLLQLDKRPSPLSQVFTCANTDRCSWAPDGSEVLGREKLAEKVTALLEFISVERKKAKGKQINT